MSDAVVNQPKTIDQLDPIPQDIDKQAFIDSAFVPIRGTVNNVATTYKVTGSDLAASGENKIDSISVNGTNVAPVNKNVDLTIPAEQVNADWNSESGKAQILNKPSVENGAQVNKIEKVKLTSQTEDYECEIDDKELAIKVGSGGFIINQFGELDVACSAPLKNNSATNSIILKYDDTLTLTGNDDDTLSVSNPVPSPSDDHSDIGKVLTVQQASDPSDPDEIVWAVPQGGGGIPDPTGVTNGYVLTVNNGAAGWAAPGGGGSSNVEQISMICLKNQSTGGQTVIQSVSMTPKQALQSYNSGKTLILNVIVKANLSSDEIWEQYTYPLSYLGYGWDEEENRYYILYFDYISALEGTGADLWHGVKGKLNTTDGTWEISSPSDN